MATFCCDIVSYAALWLGRRVDEEEENEEEEEVSDSFVICEGLPWVDSENIHMKDDMVTGIWVTGMRLSVIW